MRRTIGILFALFASAPFAAVPIVGGPCEGCEAVFDLRTSAPVRVGRIAPSDAVGQRMRLFGVVRGADGRPRAGVVVYAYHTNASGIYEPDEQAPSRAGRRHGRYRGWVQTDQDGWYEFDTVRPGGYPGSDLPEHVHIHVLEPGCATYYLEDVTFSDDPRLTASKRRELASGRGGSGLSTPKLDSGRWHARRDILLGDEISGYPACK